MEMLEAGYATNVEFHYLHHRPGGGALRQCRRDVRAHRRGGAPHRHRPDAPAGALPVRRRSTAARSAPASSGSAPTPTASSACSTPPRRRSATCRPTPASAWRRTRCARSAPRRWRSAKALRPGRPLHMHLAEQIPEVEEVVAAYGRRPVEWLLDHHAPDRRWTLIHLTHMTEDETRRLAATGAVAGLCPITESSLGDGIFNGTVWKDAGGRLGFGSDSNIRIALGRGAAHARIQPAPARHRPRHPRRAGALDRAGALRGGPRRRRDRRGPRDRGDPRRALGRPLRGLARQPGAGAGARATRCSTA